MHPAEQEPIFFQNTVHHLDPDSYISYQADDVKVCTQTGQNPEVLIRGSGSDNLLHMFHVH